MNFRLPSWEELTICLCDTLNELGDTAHESIRAERDLLLRAFRATHRLRSRLADDGAKVIEVLRNVLYRGFTVSREGVLWLECILALSRQNRTYVTFNFDDLVEAYAYEVYSEVIIAQGPVRVPRKRTGQIDSFHIHGIISKKPREDEMSTTLILDLISYVEQYAHYPDYLAVTLLSAMANYRCLFLGLSMVDPNLLRLIRMASYLRADGACWGIAFGSIGEELASTLARWGVVVARVDLGTSRDYSRIPQQILGVLRPGTDMNIDDKVGKFCRAFQE